MANVHLPFAIIVGFKLNVPTDFNLNNEYQKKEKERGNMNRQHLGTPLCKQIEFNWMGRIFQFMCHSFSLYMYISSDFSYLFIYIYFQPKIVQQKWFEVHLFVCMDGWLVGLAHSIFSDFYFVCVSIYNLF